VAVLNRHIVSTHDAEATAQFYMQILGLEPAIKLGEFVVLRSSPDTTLDFIAAAGDDFDRQHYAFLVNRDGVRRDLRPHQIHGDRILV